MSWKISVLAKVLNIEVVVLFELDPKFTEMKIVEIRNIDIVVIYNGVDITVLQ